MGDGVRLLDRGDLDELAREERPAERPARQSCIGPERPEDVVTRELFADVEHVGASGAGGQGAIAHRLELLALPEIDRDGHDLRGVLPGQPRNRNRGVEVAGIREDDPFHDAGVYRAAYLFEALGERRRPTRSARDDENRVVARDRSHGLGQPRAVERFGQGLRLAPPGPDDHELLDALDPAEKLGGGTLQRRQRRRRARRIHAGPLVGAVAGALHQPQIGDVARDRRLRGVEAALAQTAAQLLLAVQRLAVDELQDERLAACLGG